MSLKKCLKIHKATSTEHIFQVRKDGHGCLLIKPAFNGLFQIAVTNHHKFSSLKQQKSFLLNSSGSEFQNETWGLKSMCL